MFRNTNIKNIKAFNVSFNQLSKDSLAFSYRSLERKRETDKYKYLELEKRDPENRYLELLKLQLFGQKYHAQGYKLTNTKMFEEVIETLETYTSKNSFNTYRLETYLKHKSKLPGYDLFLQDLNHLGSTLLPYLGNFRSALLTLINYSELLKEKGEIKKSEKLLNLAINVIVTFTQDIDFYIDYAVLKGIISRLKEYPNIEQFKDAVSLIHANDKIQDEKNESWKNYALFYERGSLIGQSISPHLLITDQITFDQKEIEPIRLAEYSLLERHFTYTVIILLSILLLGLLIIRSQNKDSLTSSFYDLKVSKNKALKIILISIILYQIYKLLPFASIQKPLHKTDLIFIWELLLLFIFALYISSLNVFTASEQKVKKRSSAFKLVSFGIISISVYYVSKHFININTNISQLFREYLVIESMSRNPFVSDAKVSEYIGCILLILLPLYAYFLLHVRAFYSRYIKQIPNLSSKLCTHISVLIICLSLYSLVYLRISEGINYYKDSFYRVSQTNYAEFERRIVTTYKKILLENVNLEPPQ